MTVLLVEDEVLIRHFLACELQDAGLEVVEVGNADDALVVLQSRTDIDTVITDINMPGSIDGLRLAYAVRNRWPPIRVVVVSGRRYLTADELPPDALFVRKPFVPSDVITAVRQSR